MYTLFIILELPVLYDYSFTVKHFARISFFNFRIRNFSAAMISRNGIGSVLNFSFTSNIAFIFPRCQSRCASSGVLNVPRDTFFDSSSCWRWLQGAWNPLPCLVTPSGSNPRSLPRSSSTLFTYCGTYLQADSEYCLLPGTRISLSKQ